MDGRRDFTIDPDNFGDLPALVDEVKQDGLRFIIILDPAIANDYQTYDRGVELSVYAEWVNATIKPDDQPTDSNIIIGNVYKLRNEKAKRKVSRVNIGKTFKGRFYTFRCGQPIKQRFQISSKSPPKRGGQRRSACFINSSNLMLFGS